MYIHLTWIITKKKHIGRLAVTAANNNHNNKYQQMLHRHLTEE